MSEASHQQLSDWRDQWQLLVLANRLDEALALSADTRAQAEEHGDLASAIQADHARSEVLTLLPGPKAEALTLAVDAAVEAAAFGFADVEARARIAEGHALASVGSVHAGIDTLLRAKQTLRGLGDVRGLAWADLRVTRALLAAGEPDAATRTADRILAWARDNDDTMLEAAASAARAETLVAQQRADQARAQAQVALELALAADYRLLAYQAHIVLGDCAALDDDAAGALEHWRAAGAIRPEFPEVQWRLGRWHRSHGAPAVARAQLEPCIEACIAEGNSELESRARLVLADVARAEGDAAEATRQEELARRAQDGYREVAFDEAVASQLAAFEAARREREERAETDRRA